MNGQEVKSNGLDIPGRLFAAKITLIIGIILLIIKFIGYYLTNSTAILSDALESIVNVVTALMALFAIRISARPADRSHPYGHGKIEFFSSGIEGLMISVAGVAIVYKAIESFLLKPQVVQLTMGLILITIAGIINGGLGWYLIKKSRDTKSATLNASGFHVLSDAYTSLGVIIGLLLVKFTNIWWLDPLTAAVLGIHIGWHGYKIVTESFHRLMDSSDPNTLDLITEALNKERQDEWIAPHRLRSWRSGADLFVDFHLVMPYYHTLRETHSAEHQIHDLLDQTFKEPVEVILHTEPCLPQFCEICNMKDCPVRKFEQAEELVWKTELLTGELNRQVKGESPEIDPDKVFE